MKKIYENEKRLKAGEYTLDLLAHDFVKNYNMYIFPVHWQFKQLDQHPADGYVSSDTSTYSRTLCGQRFIRKGMFQNPPAIGAQFVDRGT